jgi:CBS domain containing-hemolysin-like protein
MMLAPAFRVFARSVRWLLILLNGTTNALLRLCRVTPRGEIVTVRDREQLRHLVGESQRLGLIDQHEHDLLSRALAAPERPVAEVVVPAGQIVSVAADAPAQDVIDTAARSGRTRLVVRHPDGQVHGAVHVRAALVARARGRAWTAGSAATPIPPVRLDADVTAAAETLRGARAQLGLVVDRDDRVVGLVSMDDLLGRILVS